MFGFFLTEVKKHKEVFTGSGGRAGKSIAGWRVGWG
jgi:hypothetical protein